MSQKDPEDYWEDILSSISEKKCTPIIGEQVYAPWMSLSRTIANEWAKKYGYPLEDSYQLSRVAQFLALEKADESFPKNALLREFGDIEPPDFSAKELENSSYSVLADLNLPIYITTNYDLFMEAALKAKGKSPVSEFCRWNKDLVPELDDAGILSVFDKKIKYVPKQDTPLVYHLYGLYRLRQEYRPGDIDTDIDIPQSLVLTEKDYIDFTLTLNREGDQNIFPTHIRKALSITSLLFIGYNLDDLSFRIIFQGVVNSQSHLRGTSVSVQLPPNANPDLATKYLVKYTKQMFKVHVYWGDSPAFCKELRQRLDNLKDNQGATTVVAQP